MFLGLQIKILKHQCLPAKPPKNAPSGDNNIGIIMLPINLSRSDEKINEIVLFNTAKIKNNPIRIRMQINVINKDFLNFLIITPIKKPVVIQMSSEGIRGCTVKLIIPN